MRYAHVFLACCVSLLANLSSSAVAETPKIIVNTQPSAEPKSLLPDFDADPFADPDLSTLETNDIIWNGSDKTQTPKKSDKQIIREIETYLNKITTLEADIVQHNRQGFVEGKVYLSRPGKLRLNYNNIDDHIVADGSYIYFWDSEWKNYSHAPIGSTIADAFLREKVSLTQDLKVTNLYQAGNIIEVTIVQRSDPSLGELTMNFSAQPLMLTGWRVRDGGSSFTDIRLIDPQYGVKLDKKLFRKNSNLRNR